jgi:hypothetical protein
MAATVVAQQGPDAPSYWDVQFQTTLDSFRFAEESSTSLLFQPGTPPSAHRR